MNARQRIIAAFEGRQPDEVPHFELEMQLTQEFFGRHYVSAAEWDAATPAQRREHLRRDAQLLVDTADRFDYGVIFYSWVHRPTFDDYREGLRVLAELNGGKRLLMAHGDATPSIPSGSDMDRVIVQMMLEPEKVKADVRRAVDGQLERCALLKADGLEGVALCSDYCFNSGPFLSPVMFSDIVTPGLTRLTQAQRAMGLWTIKHTDGNIMPILDDLIASGPHCLHSLDPMAGVDIAEVKRRTAGRLCLMGNVNCALMQTGSDEQVLESCRYAMASGRPGGGYIFSTSNVIFQGMPRQRYELIWDFWKKHCRY